jgi:hypothetical protein
MSRPKTIDSFFKKKYASYSEVNSDTHLNRPLATDLNASVTDERPSKCPRILPEEMMPPLCNVIQENVRKYGNFL